MNGKYPCSFQIPLLKHKDKYVVSSLLISKQALFDQHQYLSMNAHTLIQLLCNNYQYIVMCSGRLCSDSKVVKHEYSLK